MKRSFRFPLTLKFTFIFLLIELLIGALIVFAAYGIYQKQIFQYYENKSTALIEAAGAVIDWDNLEAYSETKVADDNHTNTLLKLRLCANAGGATYAYIIIPVGDDIAFIYDTDETEMQYQVGEIVSWETEFGNYADTARQFVQINTALSEEEEYGHILGFYTPFFKSDGSFSGYLGIDYNIDALQEEQSEFAWQLAVSTLIVACLMTILFIMVLRRFVVKPLKEITKAANNYLVDTSESVSNTNSITDLNITTKDEMGSLSEALKTMEREIRGYLENLEEVGRRNKTDAMTDMLNRETFETKVSWVLGNDIFSGYYVFIMIDIDYFKEVNDEFGHDIGDKVLRECSQVIRSRFRATDFIARMGGDELAVFYKGPASIDSIENKARLLNDTIRSLDIEENLRITISVGVAVISAKDRIDYESLYRTADQALYEAKEQGRNTHVTIFIS